MWWQIQLNPSRKLTKAEQMDMANEKNKIESIESIKHLFMSHQFNQLNFISLLSSHRKINSPNALVHRTTIIDQMRIFWYDIWINNSVMRIGWPEGLFSAMTFSVFPQINSNHDVVERSIWGFWDRKKKPTSYCNLRLKTKSELNFPDATLLLHQFCGFFLFFRFPNK